MGLVILGVIIGFVSGWLMLRALINYKMKLMLESIAETPTIINRVDIDIVKIKDRFYVYRRDDKSFLVYGETKKDLIDQLQSRWPDKAFMASPKNIKEVGLNDIK